MVTALVALQSLGRRTTFLGKVGHDAHGRVNVAGLQAEGVDTTGVVVAPGLATQFAFIAVERGSGRRTIFWMRASMAKTERPPPGGGRRELERERAAYR